MPNSAAIFFFLRARLARRLLHIGGPLPFRLWVSLRDALRGVPIAGEVVVPIDKRQRGLRKCRWRAFWCADVWPEAGPCPLTPHGGHGVALFLARVLQRAFP